MRVYWSWCSVCANNLEQTTQITQAAFQRKRDVCMVYQMELAEEAILGQRSAASLATGPVIPDPFISPLGLTMTPALSTSQAKTANLTLEVEIHAVLSSPALSLSHDNSGHD